ncbi:hypothetical protein CC80DRAFT_107309 [Byssothecium circinans]|uniref:Uncharacterized protein n=1 Tax=Byssothecium circinans TaxID=147558 RepID=A0A6A5UQ30_9PLEO|nr:hypothetical protein CC80DRAFT_107309 [Byssothecium circinans]
MYPGNKQHGTRRGTTRYGGGGAYMLARTGIVMLSFSCSASHKKKKVKTKVKPELDRSRRKRRRRRRWWWWWRERNTVGKEVEKGEFFFFRPRSASQTDTTRGTVTVRTEGKGGRESRIFFLFAMCGAMVLWCYGSVVCCTCMYVSWCMYRCSWLVWSGLCITVLYYAILYCMSMTMNSARIK